MASGCFGWLLILESPGEHCHKTLSPGTALLPFICIGFVGDLKIFIDGVTGVQKSFHKRNKTSYKKPAIILKTELFSHANVAIYHNTPYILVEFNILVKFWSGERDSDIETCKYLKSLCIFQFLLLLIVDQFCIEN